MRLLLLYRRPIVPRKLRIEQNGIRRLVEAGRAACASPVRLAEQAGFNRTAEVEDMVKIAKTFPRDLHGLGVVSVCRTL